MKYLGKCVGATARIDRSSSSMKCGVMLVWCRLIVDVDGEVMDGVVIVEGGMSLLVVVEKVDGEVEGGMSLSVVVEKVDGEVEKVVHSSSSRCEDML